MRSPVRRTWLLLSILLFPLLAYGQSLHLDFQQTELEDALETLRARTGMHLVYAHRLVANRTTSCRYRGSNVEEALACILQDTGLRYRKLKPSQFVLLAPPEHRVTLAGRIFDAESGEALSRAHVYLPEEQRGVLTNEEGYFSLSLASDTPRRVVISFLGYTVLDTMLTPGATVSRLVLHPRTYTAPEVIVEAGRQQPSLLPGLTHVSARQWSAFPTFLGEPDLLRALERTASIQRQGELGGELTIRGAAPDQVLYLIDGVPVYYPYHTFGIFSIFQTETLRNVTLHRGVFPAALGGRLGAVVEADLKDGGSRIPELQVGLSPVSFRASASGAIGNRGSLLLAFRRSYIDWILRGRLPIQTPESTGEPLDVGYYLYDVTLRGAYAFTPTHRLIVTAYQGGDRLRVNAPFQALGGASSPLLNLQLYHHWGNRFLQLQHRYVTPALRYWHTSLYYSAYTGKEYALLRPALTATVHSTYEVHMEDFALRSDVQWPATPDHQLTAGAHITLHRFKSFLQDTLHLAPGLADTLDQTLRKDAVETVLYMEDRFPLHARVQAMAGLRLTHFSSGNYLRLSPRLALQWMAVPERLHIKVGVNRTFQFIHRLRDRYAYVYDVTSTRWLPATPAIRPASATEGSLQVETFPLPWLTLQLELYLRRARNVLVPRDIYQQKDQLLGPGIALGTLLQQYAPGDNLAYGLEWTAHLRQRSWSLSGFYTLARTMLRPHTARSYYAAPYDIAHTVQTSFNYASGKWQYALLLLLRSGYPYHQPEGSYTLHPPTDEADTRYLYLPEAYNARLPLYFRVDASVGYRFAWGRSRWSLDLQVYNLLNHRNVIGRRYRWAEDRFVMQSIRGLPIIPVPTVRMQW